MNRAWFLWRGMVAGFIVAKDDKGGMQTGDVSVVPAMSALLATPALLAANTLNLMLPYWAEDDATAFKVGKGLAHAVFGASQVTDEFEALDDELAHDLRDMVRDHLGRIARRMDQMELEQMVDTYVAR